MLSFKKEGMEEGLLQRKQEEEMVGEALQGRWARNNNNTNEITIDTSGSSMPSKPAIGTGYLNVEGEDKRLQESTGIYYDTAKGKATIMFPLLIENTSYLCMFRSKNF